MKGTFCTLEPFDEHHVTRIRHDPGVYVIWLHGSPFYVGRSRVSIRDRIYKHWSKQGSTMIAGEPLNLMTFEYSYDVESIEQAEAVLIKELETYGLGNLRRETDPADW